MKFKNSGISRVIPVVILIVIVAIAAIAFYSLTSSSKTSSTSSASTSSVVSSSFQSSTSSSTTSSTTTTMSSPSSTTSTSSATSSTTPSTTSSTTSTATCITGAPSNSTEGLELVGWFGNYTSLAMGFNGTMNGKAADLNFTYTVAYKSPTTYKVSLNIILNGKTSAYTIWDLTNGTVLALLLPNGKNDTGQAANNLVLGVFYDLETLNTIALQSTDAAYFHSTGTSTVTIGTNSFQVTNYVANATPESLQGCNNSGYGTLNNYSVNLGTPSGSSSKLVVSANFAGSITNASGTTITFDATYHVSAFTIA